MLEIVVVFGAFSCMDVQYFQRKAPRLQIYGFLNARNRRPALAGAGSLPLPSLGGRLLLSEPDEVCSQTATLPISG